MRKDPFLSSLVATVVLVLVQYGAEAAFHLSQGEGQRLFIWSCVLFALFLGYMLWPKLKSLSSAAVFAGTFEMDSMRDRLRALRTIDGVFIGGRAVFQEDNETLRGRVRHVILPSNDAGLMRRLSAFTAADDADVFAGVKFATDRVRSLGPPAEVRWTKDFPGSVLLFGDADGPNGWVQVEPLLLGLETGHRPVIRIKKSTHPEAFASLLAAFQALWTAATPAPDL